MASFSEYIKSTGAVQLPEREELDGIVSRYPWFTAARIVRAAVATGNEDRLLELHYISHPRPRTIQYVAQAPATDIDHAPTLSTELDMIDSFLTRGEHRVVPTDDTPEHDAAARSAVLDTSDELVSEELAEIYRMQGLIVEAKLIYERLSLLYPEKSVYFAEIIGEMESGAR